MIRTEPGPSPDEVKVTFVLTEPFNLDSERDISVVGDFNGWNPGTTPFALMPDGSLEATAVVRAGERYAFRYLAENNRWLNDHDHGVYEPNGSGEENSVLDVTKWDLDASAPAEKLAL